MTVHTSKNAPVAVYCASSMGKQKAYQLAAISVGHALALARRRLVYGGGSKGIMGVVSGAALERGGEVTGVVPEAMVAAGGEGSGDPSTLHVFVNEPGRESIETIVVGSMHERKVEMAKRACAFIGLPGGFGTFEEVLEVITWTQLAIHTKPIILVNVLSYWEPLRQLIRSGIREGFIPPTSENIVVFVDGPGADAPAEANETFDWGAAAIKAIEEWKHELAPSPYKYDWTRGTNASNGTSKLNAT